MEHTSFLCYIQVMKNIFAKIFKKKYIYLDHASTTPIDTGVLREMNRVYNKYYYNVNSWYTPAVQTKKLVQDARTQVAVELATTSDHIVFTGGGTEANHLVIMGVLRSYQKTKSGSVPHMIISEIEHASVIEMVKQLTEQGVITLSYIPVTEQGIICLDTLKTLLTPETILVSVMYANNEIGTIQPIREIAKLLRWYKKNMMGNHEVMYPLFHTDTIAGSAYVDLDTRKLGVDFMTLSGSKIYGPKSVGVVYMKHVDSLYPDRFGGDQEYGLRPGTQDPASIVGMAHALSQVRAKSISESIRLSQLRDQCIDYLQQNIPGSIINGSLDNRLPNNIHISIPGISGERLVIELDARGIAVATRSACSMDREDESHVIMAIHKQQSQSGYGNIRITMGSGTTKQDMAYATRVLVDIVQKIHLFEKGLKILA